jgi:hypothetical protein
VSVAAAVPSSDRGLLKRVGWGVLLVLAVLVFLLAGRYLTLDPDVYFAEQRAVYVAHVAGITIHVGGAMLAVVLGPFQFLPRMRTGRSLRVHRWQGRTYLVCVLVGGLGGLYMARLAYGGLPARVGFAFLAIAWLGSGLMAYRHIRRREIQRHRQWMIRNYALTFAGVMLRLWLPALQGVGVEFVEAYITVAWLAWVPNLLVAEWIVSRIRSDRRLAAAGFA